MCPWVGPHAPSFGRQLWGMPSRVEYLSPQGVLLPLVYGTTASPLWPELRGLSAWQATPSWTVYRLACQRLLPWLRVTFAMVPYAAWPGSDQRPWRTAPAAAPVGRLGHPSAPDPCGVGSFLSLSRPTCARVCGVLGHLAPVHRCARLARCFACAVAWATWFLFTGVPARCVVLLVRCPGPVGSCSPVWPLGALLLCVRWPGPLGSCSPVCALGAVFCLCGVLGPLAAVHRRARLVRCFACAVSWATWLPFTSVPARRVVLRVRCPGPLGSCSPVCPLRVLCRACGVLGHLAPVHRCARSACCVACAVSRATWLLFTSVPALCAVLRVRALGPLAPVHRRARLVRCFACAVSWATLLLFTSVPARRVVLRVRCPGPLGSCSPVCPLRVLCRVCGVLGHLAPVHRCARSACCVACAVSRATWLLFTSVPARCAVLRVRCPGPLGSCSPVCPLGVLFCLRLSWATCLLFTGVPARCVGLLVRCPGPLGSCSPVCPLGTLPVCAVSWATWLLFTGVPAWCVACVCGVLGHLAPVHRCARLVCYVVCGVTWASWLLFTGVPAWCVTLRVRCPGPLGSCSPVCPLGALFCVCRVLGHLAPVHRCARSACCVACAVSWATWLLFTGVSAWCVACVCAVLGHLAPVHRCAGLVRCFLSPRKLHPLFFHLST